MMSVWQSMASHTRTSHLRYLLFSPPHGDSQGSILGTALKCPSNGSKTDILMAIRGDQPHHAVVDRRTVFAPRRCLLGVLHESDSASAMLQYSTRIVKARNCRRGSKTRSQNRTSRRRVAGIHLYYPLRCQTNKTPHVLLACASYSTL